MPALAAPPPLPPPALTAPAPYEVSFGRVAGLAPKGTVTIAVRAGGRLVAVRGLHGRRFDIRVSLPQREQAVRVIATDARGRRSTAAVPHVLGLPLKARPRGSIAHLDPRLARRVVPPVRAFRGSSAVYVRDLRTGAGAAWNARAHFPAGSTLKVAIAVEVLRTLDSKPSPGSYADTLLRRALVHSDNEAANALEVLVGGSTSGGSARVNALMGSLGLTDSEMYGGYERGTYGRRPIPLRRDEQPAYGVGKHTTAFDLAQLFAYVHLATEGRGRLARLHRGFTRSDARYLLYLLSHSTDRGKLDRYLAGGGATVAHKAGWITSARHDAGLVYWRGGVYAVAVMTHGSGVGTASDVLAGRVARRTLDRLRALRTVGSARPRQSVFAGVHGLEPLRPVSYDHARCRTQTSAAPGSTTRNAGRVRRSSASTAREARRCSGRARPSGSHR